MRCLHICVLLVLPAINIAPAIARPNAATHVVIISVDGLRADAIAASGATVMTRMMREGASTLTCENELPPSTLPNHASMLTGLPVAQHGILFNWESAGTISKPTIIDMASRAGLTTAFFASKNKFSYLCKPESATVREIETKLDRMTDRVAATFASLRPSLTFIHFSQPDGEGHRVGWMSPEYLAAVRRVDAFIGQLLDALDQAAMSNSTCIILTSDHGGNGKTHAFDTPLERLVPLILYGAGVRGGMTIDAKMYVRDVAPLTCHLLGLKMSKKWRQRIPTDVFIESKPVQKSLVVSAPKRISLWPPIGLACIGVSLLWLSHRQR